MYLSSPVTAYELETEWDSATEILNEVESDNDDRADALETIEQITAICEALGESVPDHGETANFDGYWDCHTFYDSSGVKDALQESIEDSYSIPEVITGWIDWEGMAESHRADCVEFTHDGTTYYAVN